MIKINTMEKHLKPKQYYIDQYDRHTVEVCRTIENIFKEVKLPPIKVKQIPETEQPERKLPFLKFALWMRSGERYKNKEQTIQEWMNKDRERDLFVENTKAPEDITCLVCGRLMFVTFSYLDSDPDNNNRISFFYDCPLNHVPRRIFYHTGEEFKPKPHLCTKCNSVMKRTSERLEKGKQRKVVTIETCTNCNHVEKDEMILSDKKKEKIDLNYVEDRNRFCSDKDGAEYVLAMARLEDLSKFMKEHEEKQNQKDVYQEISKIKKLKIIEVEQLLLPILEKEKYIKFHFKDPEMHKDLIVSFVTHDSKVNRSDRESYKTLTKLINKNLEGTNWRLTGDVSYRLGMLEGRLKACEKDEDLMKLIKPHNDNSTKIKF